MPGLPTKATKCPVCKKKVMTWPYRLKQGPVHCSQKCWRKAWAVKVAARWDSKFPRLSKRCTVCRTLYKLRDNVASRNRKTCSKLCGDALKRGLGKRGGIVKKICLGCLVSFQTARYRAKKQKFCSQKCYLIWWLKNVMPDAKYARPNKAERALAVILKPYGFRYTGDGSVMVGSKNPDFVHKEKRLIVELFGEHWHTKKEIPLRRAYFQRRGYRSLFIWHFKLKNKPDFVASQILRFLSFI